MISEGWSGMNYFLFKQLPVLAPCAYEDTALRLGGARLKTWVQARALELTYSAYDLEGFARDLGDESGPFVWHEERRFVMRAELDAAYLILDVYGAMAEAAQSGKAYQTIFDPPSGEGSRHPAR